MEYNYKLSKENRGYLLKIYNDVNFYRRNTVWFISLKRGAKRRTKVVEGEGFEPSKAEPSDLQSDPFGHSGTPPHIALAYYKLRVRITMVEGEGFEPSKAEPADLQSAPFGHSGTPPQLRRQ